MTDHPNEERERESFEKWARKACPITLSFSWGYVSEVCADSYLSGTTRLAWESWLARARHADAGADYERGRRARDDEIATNARAWHAAGVLSDDRLNGVWAAMYVPHDQGGALTPEEQERIRGHAATIGDPGLCEKATTPPPAVAAPVVAKWPASTLRATGDAMDRSEGREPARTCPTCAAVVPDHVVMTRPPESAAVAERSFGDPITPEAAAKGVVGAAKIFLFDTERGETEEAKSRLIRAVTRFDEAVAAQDERKEG